MIRAMHECQAASQHGGELRRHAACAEQPCAAPVIRLYGTNARTAPRLARAGGTDPPRPATAGSRWRRLTHTTPPPLATPPVSVSVSHSSSCNGINSSSSSSTREPQVCRHAAGWPAPLAWAPSRQTTRGSRHQSHLTTPPRRRRQPPPLSQQQPELAPPPPPLLSLEPRMT